MLLLISNSNLTGYSVFLFARSDNLTQELLRHTPAWVAPQTNLKSNGGACLLVQLRILLGDF